MEIIHVNLFRKCSVKRLEVDLVDVGFFILVVKSNLLALIDEVALNLTLFYILRV
jgi:hypothetical protein